MKTNTHNQFYRNTAPKPNPKIIRKLAFHTLWLLGGVLAGRLLLLDNICIGSLSYIVVSAFSSSMIPAFIGCIIGRLSIGIDSPIPFELVPEVLCFCTLFLLTIIKYQPKRRIYLLIAITARLPLLMLTSFTLYDIISFVMSCALLLGCSLCFMLCLEAIERKDIKSNIVLIATSAALLISGLPDINIFTVSIFMVLASTIVLLSAISLGSSYAGAAGAIIGLSLALSGNGGFEVGGMLAICGLICGIMYNYSKYTVIPIYIASCISLSLLCKSDVYFLMNLPTMIVSGIIAICIPNSFIYQLTKQVSVQEKIQRWRSIDGVSKKVLQLSKCLDSLKNVFDDVSIDESQTLNSNAPLLQEINQRSCKGCENEHKCWETNLYDTYRALGNVISSWDEKNPPDPSKIPKKFMNGCKNIAGLLDGINETYNLYIMKSNMTKRIFESKKLIKNHLNGSSQILEQMSSEISENFLSDQEKVYKALAGSDNIIYPINERNGEFIIKCRSCGSMGTCSILARKISKATGTHHTVRAKRCGSSSGHCNVCIAPVTGLDVFYSVAQKAKSTTLCGDAFAMTHLASGAHLIAVADGMGSGARAALEAKASIELLREFLNTGFDENTVFSIINRALLLRSGTETFAALDACIIDPIDRYYQFLKVGAPASYIYRQGAFIKIQSPSMPLGIMENADCACIKREAYPGDIVIIASDGFDPSSLHPSLMERNATMTKLPRILLNNNVSTIPDDVTIVTAKIKSPPSYSRKKAQLDDWKLRVASGCQ